MKSKAQQPAVDKQAAHELRERLRGLSPELADTLRRVMRLHAAGDRLMSSQWLLQAAMQAPEHPEVLRWRGIHHADAGEWPQAAACLASAAALRPSDHQLWLLLGQAQDHLDDGPAAQRSLREGARHASGAAAWLALSLEFDRQGLYDDSLAAIEQLLAAEPRSTVGLLQRSRCFKALGRAAEAAADCRTLIALDREAARAWFALVDLKTVSLAEDELARLEQAANRPGTLAADRLLLDFALGKALEDAGQHDKAYAVFERANRAAQPTHPWDRAAFARQVAALRAAFAPGLPARAQPQGGELIFLVGLPRSGTTLTEQVLASHSQVEGASELPYLNMVVEQESRRRGRPLAEWAALASTEDWTRLGQAYLRLSAKWRLQKPRCTDKLPENWLLAGAALAMLPQARVIDCRRDAVETCWSCYKQLFGPGRVGFTYDLADLAGYWHEYDRLCRFWADLYPQAFHVQHYEALAAEPETQIRALLDFCGLPFEAQCLSFHTAERAIRTPSALQVRQPLRQTSTPAARYGALMDPLRALLADPGTT